MKRLSVIVLLAVLGLGTLAACDWFRAAADDEVPIIVRGGSIDITGEEFEPDGTDFYTHKTASGNHQNTLWVKVISTAGTGDCASVGSGNLVDLSYSDGFGIKFDIKAVGAKKRTWIKPQGGKLQWDAKDPKKLGYPNSGFISGVRVGGWNCTLNQSSGLSEIKICSSDTSAACK